MAKITKRTIDALKPGDRPYIVFDDNLSGFGVRVMPSGVASYVLEYRAGGGGRGVAKSRLTIARVGALTPDEARKAAERQLAAVKLGAIPPRNWQSGARHPPSPN